MPIAIIRGALLGIAQNSVSLCGLLELFFRFVVAGVAVGVILHGEPAISRLENLLIRSTINAKNFVKVAFRHRHFLLLDRHAHHGGSKKLATEVVALLEFGKNALIFGFVRFYHVDSVMEVGVE